MQIDMHYYGTYAMAIAAGIPPKDAEVIAYAAQFVDDSTRYDSSQHSDGGLIYGITTAHHPAQAALSTWGGQIFDTVKNTFSPAKAHGYSNEEQRRVWIPFHFFPGGIGNTAYEKIICVKDGNLVNEALQHCCSVCEGKSFSLELIGICAHVYMDTFAHYGFSGLSSRLNGVQQSTISFVAKNSEIQRHIEEKMTRFLSTALEQGSSKLGHGSVATLPDRPYLQWSFSFDQVAPQRGQFSERNNKETFLEGCQQLHRFFCEFAQSRYPDAEAQDFSSIKGRVEEIIAIEGTQEERIKGWKTSTLCGKVRDYDPLDWEGQKKEFHHLSDSTEIIKSNVYRFHQAASFFRGYTLKELLPSHGIAVY